MLESNKSKLRTLLTQRWSSCLRWQTGDVARLAADSAWSEETLLPPHYRRPIHGAFGARLEFLFLFLFCFFHSFGKGGNVASVFILRTAFMAGLQLSQVMIS